MGQKQKQKQSNKNQDSDTMSTFDRKNQLHWNVETANYFQYTLTPHTDLTKIMLGLPFAVPILKMAYGLGGKTCWINVYPTLQFLYSHHIIPDYITAEVKQIVSSYTAPDQFCRQFRGAAEVIIKTDKQQANGVALEQLDFDIKVNYIKQNPLYTMAALQNGVYVIGMKDQFNIHDLGAHPMSHEIQYVSDEMG